MAGVIESEIESLSLIFGENELVLIEPNQHIQLTISPLAEEARVSAILDIKFPEDYPNVPPILNVEPLTGIGAHEASDFSNRASELAQENVGMEMIFTIAEAVREWLTEYQDSVWTKAKDTEKEEPKTKKVEEDILFQHGTPVTPESFLQWKKNFDAEVEENKRLQAAAAAVEVKGKLTGRQLFEIDASLFSNIVEEFE